MSDAIAEATAVVGITSAIIAALEHTSQVLVFCFEIRSEIKTSVRELEALIQKLTQLRNVLELVAESVKETSNSRRLSNLSSIVDSLGSYSQSLRHLKERLQKVRGPSGGNFKSSLLVLFKINFRDFTDRASSLLEHINILVLTNEKLHQAKEVASQLQRIRIQPDGLSRKQMLFRALSPPDSTVDHNAALLRRMNNSGMWLLQSKVYEQWKTDPASVLWLYGMPGSGKTVLCSCIIDDVRENLSGESTALVFFYFKFNDTRKQQYPELIRSLAYQLLSWKSDVPEVAKSLYEKIRDQTQIGTEELMKCFVQMIREFEAVYIVLDALDECANLDQMISLFIQPLIESRKDIPQAHFLISSRSQEMLNDLLNPFPRISCDAKSVQDDIQAYIRARLENEVKAKRWPTGVKREIEDSLTKKANGRFMWVDCQIESLLRCVTVHQMEDTLVSLPKTLEETYAQILHRTEADFKHEARVILEWLVYATRPMRIEEIMEVLAIDLRSDEPSHDADLRFADPRDVLRMCSGLVTTTVTKVDDYDGEARDIELLALSHFSVKEYLVSDRVSPSMFALTPRSHLSIAESCLVYILSLKSSDLLAETFLEEFPLHEYASRQWPLHVKGIPTGCETERLDAFIDRLLDRDLEHLLNWLRIFDPDVPWNQKLNRNKSKREVCSAIYYASSLGLPRTVKRLLANGADPNEIGGSLGSPLQTASYHGHTKIVDFLIENGAHCSLRCGRYGTALQAAKFARLPDIIERLEMHSTSNSVQYNLESHIELLQSESTPFESLDHLGVGGGGIVEKVRDMSNGQICVRKTIRTPNKTFVDDFLKEVRIMQKLSHRHIVDVLSSYTRGKQSSIIFLPVADGDLGDFLEGLDTTIISQLQLCSKWFTCLAEGLRYIHSMGVKHKDIKPQNLLVLGENILFTDFGIAHEITNELSVTRGRTEYSIRYGAPEVVAMHPRSRPADVFSLGAVYVEMLAKISDNSLPSFDSYAQVIGNGDSELSTWLSSCHTALENVSFSIWPISSKALLLAEKMLLIHPEARPKALDLAETLTAGSIEQYGAIICC